MSGDAYTVKTRKNPCWFNYAAAAVNDIWKERRVEELAIQRKQTGFFITSSIQGKSCSRCTGTGEPLTATVAYELSYPTVSVISVIALCAKPQLLITMQLSSLAWPAAQSIGNYLPEM